MLVTFVIVQFAPGGPVERVIAVLSGADTGAGSRVPGGGQGGDFGARGAARRRQLDGGAPRNIAARRASIRNSSRAWSGSSASTSRRMSASS